MGVRGLRPRAVQAAACTFLPTVVYCDVNPQYTTVGEHVWAGAHSARLQDQARESPLIALSSRATDSVTPNRAKKLPMRGPCS
ncbi:hypothetical protein GCM10027396_26810 [Insolitispirillum peregrinum]